LPATRVAGIVIAAFCLSIIAAAAAVIAAADLPDHACTRDLHQRGVRRADEFRIRVAPAGITHRAVVDQVGRSVGTEPERRWPVDSVQPSGERLIDLDLTGGAAVRIIAVGTLRAVEGEARELQLVRIPRVGEIDELNVVAFTRL